MRIRPASVQDIPLIHQLAHNTWWPAYRDILPAEQISFMLEKMYSEEALKEQFKTAVFLIVEHERETVGFASYSMITPDLFKVHKLYVLPSEQGRGTGRNLLEHIVSLARLAGGKILELNVNRHNPAFEFYKKMGFTVYEQVDIPFYEFFMNDYVMRKGL